MDYYFVLHEANLQVLTLLLQSWLWMLVDRTHPTNLHCSVAYDLVPCSEGLHSLVDCLHLQKGKNAQLNTFVPTYSYFQTNINYAYSHVHFPCSKLKHPPLPPFPLPRYAMKIPKQDAKNCVLIKLNKYMTSLLSKNLYLQLMMNNTSAMFYV